MRCNPEALARISTQRLFFLRCCFAERLLEPFLAQQDEPTGEVKPPRRKSLDHQDPAMPKDIYELKFLETLFFSFSFLSFFFFFA